MVSAVAALSSLLFFLPQPSIIVSIIASVAWFATGGGGFDALIWSRVSQVIKNPAVTGISNGLIMQFGDVAAIIAPPLFLAMFSGGVWWYFVLTVTGCISLMLIAMPLPGRHLAGTAKDPAPAL